MKRILTCLLIMQSLSFAKSGIEVKVGVNMSAAREEALFYNLYKDKGFSKAYEDAALASLRKNEIAGEIETKVLKSIKVSPSVNVKIGGGLSIYLNKSSKLTTGFKQRRTKAIPQQNGTTKIINTAELPDISGGAGITPDTNIAEALFNKNNVTFENRTGYNITTFGTLEVEKILRSDLSIYGGADLGLDIALQEKIFESTIHDNIYNGNGSDDFKGKEAYRFLIERRTKVLPRVKGYFGVDYNNFEFEVGAGYPQLITVGVGYRFKF